MRQIKISSVLLLLLFASNIFGQVRQIQETPQGISRRLQHEIDMTKDPSLGYVPKSELIKALQVRKRLLEEKSSTGHRAVLNWTERGPYKDVVGSSNGNTRAGNAITAGRVRAMWIDLSDPTGNTVWVGGVDGGLWKTNDISVRPTAWTPVNDFFGNLAIGSICQDPTNHNIMYFGTGEKTYNADAVRGEGLWVSTDHGVSWAPMPGTASFYNVSKISCDAQGNLYVGCIGSADQGLKRYNKSLATWTDITPSGLDKRIPDFTISSTGRLHVVCGYFTTTSTGYRYTDTPASVTSNSWTSATTPPPTGNNVAIASSGTTLYLLPANSNYQVTTIYKSINGGQTWAPIGSTPGFTSGQAWYCMAVAVDPANVNNVLVGSLDCYRSTNGGTSWTKVSNWVGTTGQYVHADQQAMVWSSNNRVLVASDGGIHLSNDGGVTYSDRNEGLRIKQFYSVAVHPTQTNYLLGGTQDNGMHSMNQPGLASSIEVTGGDGAFCHIDQTDGNFQIGSYVYNQYRRSFNGGSTWSSANLSSTTGRFINPTDYDDTNNILYCAAGNNQYLAWTNPSSTNNPVQSTKTISSNGQVSAVKVSPFAANTIYLGSTSPSSSGVLLKVSNANATPVVTSIGSGMFISNAYVSSIEFGTNVNTMIVCYANYGVNNVWVTYNGGTSWTAIDGNLPNMPVRWAMFMPGDDAKAIVATETGVWQTDLIQGGSTIWLPEAAFPNVRTDMLQFRASDGLLAAATHGRGIFTANLQITPTCGTVTNLVTSNITSEGASLSWDAVTGAANYTVEYKIATSQTWTPLSQPVSATSTTLTGLTASTAYEWQVRANCSNGLTGQYTVQQFSTVAPGTICIAPTGLASGTITSSGATISWNAVSGVTTYNVQYRIANGTWQILSSVMGTNVQLTGLQSGTVYQWQVQSICTNGTSLFTQSQFTTLSTTCQSAYDTGTNNTYTGSSLIPFNTDITGLINPSGDLDYYKIIITTAGTATVTLSNLVTNYDLYLFNGTGTTQLRKSTNSGNSTETITYTFAAGTYYILVRGKSGSNWNATSCYTLRVQLGTATSQEIPEVLPEEITSMQVFPNPAQQTLHIYFVGKINGHTLQILDSNGKEIYTQAVSDMLTSLDVSALVSGRYVVRILDQSNQAKLSEQFIKVE